MGSFLASAAALAAGDAVGAMKHAKRVFIAYLAIFCLVAIAVLFTLIALFHYLAEMYGPVAAGLCIGAASLLLALIVLGAIEIQRYLRRRARQRQQALRVLEATVLLSQMPRILRLRPLLTGAVIGGAVLLLMRGRRGGE